MAEIRQALAQCFKDLMQEKSFQKIIVKDITDRANVKRPTFYTYFRDKYDVVEWIFMQEIWQPANSLIAAGYIREGLRFMLISMEKDKRYYRKLAALEGQNSFQEIFVRCIRQEVEQALRENAFHPSYHLLSVELISEYFARIFWFVTEKWLNYAEEVSALEVMEVYEILFSDSAEKLLGHKVEG